MKNPPPYIPYNFIYVRISLWMHLVEYIWYLYNYMYSQLYIFTHTNVNTEVTKAQTHNSYYVHGEQGSTIALGLCAHSC